MPEFPPIVLILTAAMLLVGIAGGWFLRAGRCSREKDAIHAGWREQVNSLKSEHSRLAEQNKSLMEQVSQYQASRKDADARARELSDSLREAFARRDELQVQLRDVRRNLEAAVAERNRLQTDASQRTAQSEASARALREREEKIARLGRELENWQGRLPPLIERYRVRDLEAQELEVELARARDRIADLENLLASGQTRIDAAESSPLANGLDASNEQYDYTSRHELDGLAALATVESVDADSDDEADSDDDDGRSSVFDVLLAGDTGDADAAAAATGDEPNGAAEVFATEARDGDTHIDVALEAGDGAASVDYELSDGADDDRDDLQRIKGVGPAIEKTLNDLGIFRYEQIATLSEYEIDRVARQLKGFRSRIYREDWIGQARLLQQQKNQDPA